MGSGVSVEFCELYRSFGAVKAVDGISLAIKAGEFFTLLGPSGSGKTTLLNLLAGFQQPESGAIRIDDEVVNDLAPFQRNIGVVFQNYALFPHLTVAENVAFPLRVRRTPRGEIARRVQRALELVHLGEFSDRRITQLSGGQQQRVALARAFVFEPPLLLMDEPLSALDAKLRRSMRQEIKALQQQLGVTVIYVTHDQDEALAMSDRIAIINRGKVEQLDPPTSLYERPASRFAAEFLGDANLLTGIVHASDGETVEVCVGNNRLRAVSRASFPRGAPVVLAIRPERIMLGPPDAIPNRVTGTISAVSYGGDHSLIKVASGDDLALSIKVPVGDGPTQAEGTMVTAGWKTEYCSALRPEPDAVDPVS